MFPRYDLEKIKFATDKSTFEKAVDLDEAGKVKEFKEIMNSYSALVLSTKPYRVFVSARHYNRGNCECYLGQRDILCKHMVAVAIYSLMREEPLSEKDKELFEEPRCSGKLGELAKEESTKIKKLINSVVRKYIKAYTGPSKIWFDYQDSLSEGCNRLSAIISELPVSQQTAQLLIDLLLTLDKRLSIGGVDDSDGTVGSFIYQTVEVLREYAKFDSSTIKAFKKLQDQSTCFEWEEPLLELIEK